MSTSDAPKLSRDLGSVAGDSASGSLHGAEIVEARNLKRLEIESLA